MLRRDFRFILFTCLATMMWACGSTDKRSIEEDILDEKIAAQAPADTAPELMRRAARTFSEAPGLNGEQKNRLSEIYTAVYIKSMRIRREIGQAKSLLFATLAREDYRSAEVTQLKEKIIRLDQQRLDLMLRALEDVQSVVGRGADAEKIYKYLEEHEIPQHYRDTVMQ